MTKLLPVLLLAAACGGKAASTTPGNHAGGGGGPVYAALFEQGKTWTFALTFKTQPPPDIGPPSSGPAGTLTCTVASAHAMGDQQVAKVECTADGDHTTGDGYAPAGYWVATPAGLWHFDGGLAEDELHAKLAALDPKQMLIAAAPAARHEEVGAAENGDGLEVFGAKAEGGGWCLDYTFALGDEAGWQLCFGGDGAIASGSWFEAGATTNETSYVAK